MNENLHELIGPRLPSEPDGRRNAASLLYESLLVESRRYALARRATRQRWLVRWIGPERATSELVARARQHLESHRAALMHFAERFVAAGGQSQLTSTGLRAARTRGRQRIAIDRLVVAEGVPEIWPCACWRAPMGVR